MQQNQYPTTFSELTFAYICLCVFMHSDVCACVRSYVCARSLIRICLSTLLRIWFGSVCMCVQVSCLNWYRIRPLSSASALDTTLLTSLFAMQAAHSQKSQTSTDGLLRDRKIRPSECFIGLMPFLINFFLSSVPLSSLVHCLPSAVSH